MENASKALLIAAAVLVAIIIIAIGIKVYTSTSGTDKIAQSTGKTISDKTEEATGLLGFSSGWKQNADGTITNGKQVLKLGDSIKYENILALPENNVNSNNLTKIINNLKEYNHLNQIEDINRDSLTWKIFDVKDGKLRVISATPTTSKIRISTYDGYNNVVYLLDEACNTLYGTNKNKAQNLKIEDIEDKIKEDILSSIRSNSNYGMTKEFPVNNDYDIRHCPNIYSNEKGCISINDKNNNGKLGPSEEKELIKGEGYYNKIKVTKTSYNSTIAINTNNFKNPEYQSLFFNNGLNNYWLSSRNVSFSPTSSTIDFGISSIIGSAIGSRLIVNSYYGYYSDNYTYAFRPVVTLNSNVKLTGSSSEGWTIQ